MAHLSNLYFFGFGFSCATLVAALVILVLDRIYARRVNELEKELLALDKSRVRRPPFEFRG